MEQFYVFNATREDGSLVGQVTATDPTGGILSYTLVGYEE